MRGFSHTFRNFSAQVSKSFTISVFFLLTSISLWSQTIDLQPIPSAEWVEYRIDSLRSELLANKTIEENYEVSILAALMYYPDLKTSNIQFRKSRITTSMAAIPKGGNLFRKHKNRKYTILINNRVNSNRAPLISDVPHTAKVGIIGHELAHIVDYNTKSNLRLMYEGLSYYFNSGFKRQLEHKIDRIAIYRGLGEGIIAFRIYIDNESNATEKYKLFKQKIYLSSTDIEGIINEHFTTNPNSSVLNNSDIDIDI